MSYLPAECPCSCCPRAGEMVLDTDVRETEPCCSARTFPMQEILYHSDKTYSKFSIWVKKNEEPQNFWCFCIQFNSTVVLKDRSPTGHTELTDLRVVYPIKPLYTHLYILVTAIFLTVDGYDNSISCCFTDREDRIIIWESTGGQ